jgi:hypothetical protein
MSRRYTNLLIDDIENSLLTRKFILDNLLEWLSEDEVEEFAKSKIYTEDADEDEVEDMYTVWVGGTEVVDNYVSYKTAKEIRNKFKSEGYDDVIISIA